MKVLILGTGKMGYALQEGFSREHDVAVFGRDVFDAANPELVPELIMAERPDVVCNAVVLGGIDACEQQPGLAWQINTGFPQSLAALSRELGYHLLHISTDAVFGNIPLGEFHTESSAAAPPNVYGLTKFGADCLIPHLATSYHIVRLPLLFGPSPKGNQFFEKMLMRGLERGALKISGDIYSCAAYTGDVAEQAVQLVAEGAESGLYHVAGNEPCSLFELIDEAVTLLGLPVSVEEVSHTMFPSIGIKNVCTPMRSVKIPPLRSWRDSLEAYCKTEELRDVLAGRHGGEKR